LLCVLPIDVEKYWGKLSNDQNVHVHLNNYHQLL